MRERMIRSILLTSAVVTSAMTVASGAYAYGTKDAIRDCESRLRSEYSLSDFRDQSAEQIKDSEHHYKVKGNTKIDDKKHPFGCEIKNRHVTAVTYDGPEPEGMGTAEKLAIGAAAAIAAGVVASELSKDDDADASDECPSDIKGNECDYYKAGVDDGKMGMSMVYERHEGYDSRFEPYFARG
jgi:hypothetical protein